MRKILFLLAFAVAFLSLFQTAILAFEPLISGEQINLKFNNKYLGGMGSNDNMVFYNKGTFIITKVGGQPGDFINYQDHFNIRYSEGYLHRNKNTDTVLGNATLGNDFIIPSGAGIIDLDKSFDLIMIKNEAGEYGYLGLGKKETALVQSTVKAPQLSCTSGTPYANQWKGEGSSGSFSEYVSNSISNGKNEQALQKILDLINDPRLTTYSWNFHSTDLRWVFLNAIHAGLLYEKLLFSVSADFLEKVQNSLRSKNVRYSSQIDLGSDIAVKKFFDNSILPIQNQDACKNAFTQLKQWGEKGYVYSIYDPYIKKGSSTPITLSLITLGSEFYKKISEVHDKLDFSFLYDIWNYKVDYKNQSFQVFAEKKLEIEGWIKEKTNIE